MSTLFNSEAKRPLPPGAPGASGDPDVGEVEKEDELPTVVVLREGDVGEQEYLENRRHMKDEGGFNHCENIHHDSTTHAMPAPLH